MHPGNFLFRESAVAGFFDFDGVQLGPRTLDVAQGLAEPSVDARAVLAVARVTEAAEEAAKTGRAVKLQWTEEEIPNGYVLHKN